MRMREEMFRREVGDKVGTIKRGQVREDESERRRRGRTAWRRRCWFDLTRSMNFT